MVISHWQRSSSAVCRPLSSRPKTRAVRPWGARAKKSLRGLIGVEKILAVFAETAGRPQGQATIGKGRQQVGMDSGLLQHERRLNGHSPSFIGKMVGLRPYQAQVGKTKIHHRPRHRADIECSLRFDQDDGNIFQSKF